MAEKSSRIMPPMPDLRPPPNIHAVMVARMLPKRGRRKAEADDVGISPPSMLSSPPSSILPAGATVGTAVGTSRSGTNSNSSRMSRGWAFGAGVVGTRSMVGSDVSTVGSSVPMGTSSSKSPWFSSGGATATATSDASSGKSSSSIITDAGKSSTVGCCSWRWSVAAEAVMPAVLVLLMPLQLPHRPRRRTAHRPAERERAAQYAPKESELSCAIRGGGGWAHKVSKELANEHRCMSCGRRVVSLLLVCLPLSLVVPYMKNDTRRKTCCFPAFPSALHAKRTTNLPHCSADRLSALVVENLGIVSLPYSLLVGSNSNGPG